MLGAQTHGQKGDFILCPMLCIALDRQLIQQEIWVNAHETCESL